MDGADLRFCVWLLVSSSGGLFVLDCGGGIWLRCIGGWFPAYFALLWGCRNIVPGF